MQPPENKAQSNSKALTIGLVAVGLIFVGSLALSIVYRNTIKEYFVRRQASLTYQEFINDLRKNDSAAALTLTSASFHSASTTPKSIKGNADLTKQDAVQYSTNTNNAPTSSAQDAFNAFVNNPSYSVVKKSYTIYTSPDKPTKDGAVVLTARFDVSKDATYDVTAQLSQNNGKWQIDSLTIPDPTNGVSIQ